MASKDSQECGVDGAARVRRRTDAARGDLSQQGTLLGDVGQPEAGKPDRTRIQLNYGKGKKAAYVYLSATLNAATWEAKLARSEGRGRIYIMAPTGPITATRSVIPPRADATCFRVFNWAPGLRSIRYHPSLHPAPAAPVFRHAPSVSGQRSGLRGRGTNHY
ncbi:NAD(+)--rifampin ADP-ribosyltransferase [Variovorax paradoxus]|uniref:NAD(+)--rifampin ADP-ribosyltransferase n=1 Tax=Variovorax paradoxus TaxID=34073 RepID=UPI0035C8A754